MGIVFSGVKITEHYGVSVEPMITHRIEDLHKMETMSDKTILIIIDLYKNTDTYVLFKIEIQ
jgi:hypothetical protein